MTHICSCQGHGPSGSSERRRVAHGVAPARHAGGARSHCKNTRRTGLSRFSQRTVIVTGGASGIGAATVSRAHAEGAAVVIVDNDEADARQLAAELGADRALAFGLDVTDAGQVQSCNEAAEARFGTLDVLVNSAGVRDTRPGRSEAERTPGGRYHRLHGDVAGRVRQLHRKEVKDTADLAQLPGIPKQ